MVCTVTIPPNGGTPPHRHNGAVAVAIPISGTTINQMNGNPPKIYGPGEYWYEAPGCHHQRSENVEGGEEAKFYAVLIVDDGADPFVLDKEVEMGEKQASK
jgi:quercetin dioxygenase-like cupin family protein